jgi:STE24 endopeptidase
LTGEPEAFISGMKRLAAQNLAEARPSRLAVWLFHTHPPIEQRIDAAEHFRLRIEAKDFRLRIED